MTYATTPGGWITTKLGTVLDFKYGKSLPAKTRDGVGFPVYGSNGVIGFHSAPLIPHAGIIVGRKGSFGEVHLSLQPFSPIDTTYFIDEFGPQIIKFWFYHLKHLPLTQLNRASAIPGLNREDAYGLEVPLPPLAEQREIADRLDTLLAQVDTLKGRLDALPAILKRFRQSVLAAAVSGKLTEEWRGTSSTTFYQSPVTIGLETDAAPKGWIWSKLDELATLESGHTPRKSIPEYWDDGDIHWISLQDIRSSHGTVIQDTKYKPTMLGIENSSARLLPAGTVCFSRDISVGYTTIMGHEMSTTQHFANWICGEELINNYLMYALMAAKDHLTTSGQGSTVKTIYMPALKKFHILLPPKVEQTEIVRRVEQLFAFADQVEQRVKEAQGRVNNLTQSILAKAFRGELTAEWREQHPELISGENSASALLARIQAERAAQAPVKRTRKKKASA
ncbi:restriction endonuclease subunit S [Cobetia sp. 5-11-6-3]|uniref:restriction endonuclease subunit S n=1 Tax=Cobetia sp. 5-11-6-3 TaxID=2737458 RepID=UPI0015969463|nr:restriction endonuclease subunit S [Cobetia sp. 5-11-6-3]